MSIAGHSAIPGTWRVIRAEGDITPRGPDPLDQTLGEFVGGWVATHYLIGQAERTAEAWQGTVSVYRQITGDPPLRLFVTASRDGLDVEFCRELVRRFREGLERRRWKGKPIAHNTQVGHLKQLRAILRLAGPDPEGSGRYAGILPAVPWVKAPAIRQTDVDTLSVREIEAWLDACEQANGPDLGGLRPACWWQSLVIWLYNTGMRIGSTLAARRSWIESSGFWMVIPAQFVKGKRAPLLIYLNRWSRAALFWNRTAEDRIWPWPWTPKHFHPSRQRLIRGLPDWERFHPHALRATLATWLQARGPHLAAMQLGHSSAKDIATFHYTDKRRVLPLHLEHLPQPGLALQLAESFADATSENGSADRQLRLF